MTNYTKINIGTEDRAELHDKLGLTGAEVSVNRLPAGAGVPFVHSHRRNEEIYGILTGAGRAVIDGENVSLAAGDWLRVAPAAKRQFSAAEDGTLTMRDDVVGCMFTLPLDPALADPEAVQNFFEQTGMNQTLLTDAELAALEQESLEET